MGRRIAIGIVIGLVVAMVSVLLGFWLGPIVIQVREPMARGLESIDILTGQVVLAGLFLVR